MHDSQGDTEHPSTVEVSSVSLPRARHHHWVKRAELALALEFSTACSYIVAVEATPSKRLGAVAPKPKGPRLSTTHWVEPKVVVEVQFVEWTSDGHLRHPSLLGLRKDKKAKEVVRERPSETTGD